MISGLPLLRCPFLTSKPYIYFNASYACNGIKKKAKLKYFLRQIDLKNLTYPYGSSINGSQSKYDCCDLSYNAQCSSMWIKLHDHFWLFHRWIKKLTVFERLFLQLGTRFSGKINFYCSKVAVIERFDKKVAAVLASDWCQKTFVFFCPIRGQNGGDRLELVW